jgi:hypothetical protein
MTYISNMRTSFDRAKTPAQWYCLIAGLVLAVAGVFGFFADAGFQTGDDVQGGSLVGFEVNGIHNLVHLLSGALLLFASRTRSTAKAVAIAFGATYAVVAIIGIIDSEDVLGLIPINSADNVLHVFLALIGLVLGLVSRESDRRHSRTTLDRATNPLFERDPDRPDRERVR